jgi:arginase
MVRQFGLIGVPSSAGAHGPGQEKAPAALRSANIVGQLAAVGHDVVDHGDLARVRFRPDPAHRQAQNLALVLDVAREVAAAIADAVGARELPLVLGGDCTITLGVVAGFLRHCDDLALLYMDGGMDVATPGMYRPGILDSMGVAHLVGEAGVVDDLARLGPRYPLLPGRQIVAFGYTPGEPAEAERALLARHAITGFPDTTVQGRAEEAAVEARAVVEEKADQFVVHFDVDVLDFVDFPVADVPHINAGLTLQAALACLSVFAASPRFGGLVITEFNPDHDDEEGSLAAAFVRGVTGALTGTAQSV